MTAITKDVVVLLPGITGSVLQKDGKDVWAPRPGAVLRGLLSLGGSLRRLEVVDDDPTATDLGDGVRATGLVSAAHLIPGLWKIDVYSAIEQYLVDGLGLVKGQNYFPFPYDWRRDNRASARALQRQAAGWLRRWRETSGARDARLVLVGHSMGGLVARCFVESLGGWRDTRAVITYGTPFYGSLNAVDFLVNGFRKGIGPFSTDLSPLLRSMTSVHQLVPSYRCIDVDGAPAVLPSAAGLPGWQPAWDAHLVEFVREMDEAAARNRQEPGYDVTYHPIVGRDQPTRQSGRLRDGVLTLLQSRAGEDESGDGTVPLLSAALSGTEGARTWVPDQHSRLQSSVPMQTHLKGVVAALDQVRVDALRGVDAWFGLEVDDLYLPGEPVVLSLQAKTLQPDPSALPPVPVVVTVVDEATGAGVLRREVAAGYDGTSVELGELPPSTYVVQVDGGRRVAPVSDVLTVASPELLEGAPLP